MLNADRPASWQCTAGTMLTLAYVKACRLYADASQHADCDAWFVYQCVYQCHQCECLPWSAGDVLLEVQRYVKARVIECEECIFTASGQADSTEEPEAAETGAALKSLMPSDPVNQLVQLHVLHTSAKNAVIKHTCLI